MVLHLTYEKPQTKTRQGSVIAFVDSDWAGDRQTRKSTSSVSVFFDGMLMQAGCISQGNVAQSSAEAEFYALASAAADVLYIETLIKDAGEEVPFLQVFNDASAARQTANKQGLSRKLRHIDIKHLFVQHLVQQKRFALGIVSGLTNPANMATKLHTEQEQTFHRRQHCLSEKAEDVLGWRSAFQPHPHKNKA
jgi:hypothetical protein